MRDYPNGGFFFIDAAPIQAAGENGLHIEGIFEDATRAVKGGKVFVLTGCAPAEGVLLNGTILYGGITENEGIGGSATVGSFSINFSISSDDIVTLEITD